MEKIRTENVDPVELYLEDIRQIQPLTEAEKATLPPLLKEKDSHAVNRMVETYLPYVAEIAQEYRDLNFWRNMPDLIDEGNTALVEAVKTFDWNHPEEFTAYAYDRICDAMENFLMYYHMEMDLPDDDFVDFPFSTWRESKSQPDPDYEKKLRGMAGTGTPSDEARQYLEGNGVFFDDYEWQAVILRLGLDDNVRFCRKDVCIATGFSMERVERIDRVLTGPIRHLLYLEKRRKFLKD